MGRLRVVLGMASGVARGDTLGASERLVRHGLMWLILSIVLDFGTSWIAMSMLGPSAEGNPSQRLLFVHPSFATLGALVLNQWAWIFFAGFPVVALVLLLRGQNLGLRHPVVRRATRLFCCWSLAFTWPLAALRFILGTGSNIAGMLTIIGPYTSLAGWMVEAVVMTSLIEWDVLSTLFWPEGTRRQLPMEQYLENGKRI